MTRDEIMEMAEQAGLIGPSSRVGYSHEATERFAQLVAAAERDACAVACDEQGYFSAGLCAEKIRARSQS